MFYWCSRQKEVSAGGGRKGEGGQRVTREGGERDGSEWHMWNNPTSTFKGECVSGREGRRAWCSVWRVGERWRKRKVELGDLRYLQNKLGEKKRKIGQCDLSLIWLQFYSLKLSNNTTTRSQVNIGGFKNSINNNTVIFKLRSFDDIIGRNSWFGRTEHEMKQKNNQKNVEKEKQKEIEVRGT